MDFCEKYRLDQLKKENAVHFIKRLKAKKQTTQQQKQAYHPVFYKIIGLTIARSVYDDSKNHW